jgi:hypothetical protein
MLESIKGFLNWPAKGINNIGELSAYLRSNWLSFIVLFIGVLVVIWIIRKIFGLIANIFKD